MSSNDPSLIEAWLEAIQAGDVERVKEWCASHQQQVNLKTEANVSLPMMALYQQQREIADALFAAKNEVDRFEASAFDDSAALLKLLASEPVEIDAFSSDGFTSLHLAAFFDAPRTARVLLAHGASTEIKATNGSGLDPIHSAAASRSTRMVRILLANGADPNRQQNGGYTPLHSAAMHNNRSMVDVLLANGANPLIQADDNRTAVEFARDAGHQDLAVRLQEFSP